jgi:SAM-dependent methyltransferase
MASEAKFQDVEFLRSDQYSDSRNLTARAELHQRYGSNPLRWFTWVMDRLALQPGERILECGCGPGWLWRKNTERIPENCQITLTDLSPGMVSEAAEVLSNTGHNFHYYDADITDLPFDDKEFDVAIANHMLYHVPDRQKALSEVKRVLKEGGRFFASTVGQKHMLELRALRQRLLPEIAGALSESSEAFSLENGKAQLDPWFNGIQLHHYENLLLVTNTQHLLAYLLSAKQAEIDVDPTRLKVLSRETQDQIDRHGYFEIRTDSGMFAATNIMAA